MPLFGGGGGRSRSLQEVEQEMKGVDRSRGDFAPGLTVQELGLFQSQGYIPAGSVMGNSVFSMGLPAG
ncbi:MAG: hypothetical protein M0Z27_06795 [Thermaerobacter sp.]|nr:hypothetical protein [Thermaerobacter sp.]